MINAAEKRKKPKLKLTALVKATASKNRSVKAGKLIVFTEKYSNKKTSGQGYSRARPTLEYPSSNYVKSKYVKVDKKYDM